MLQLRTMDELNAPIDPETLEAFRATFHGRLIDEAAPDYEEARRVWNGLIDKRPALIARCSGLADVVAAVDFARTNALLTSVRGGGHNVSGSALCEGGLTIDLSQMRAVRVDRQSKTVHVQGGARLADVDRETQVFGLATTTGNISETGIAGLTLGGGFGNLRRKYGLSVDNLVSVEIVTADGSVRRAAEDENADLFWAVRGGGGNFGVVTSFEFRLHEIGPEVYFASQFFDLADAPAAMRAWRDFMESAPEDISSLAFFWTVPRHEAFPEAIRGRKVFLYGALHAGPAAEGKSATAALRAIGTSIFDMSGPGPYCGWQAGFDPFLARGPVHEELYAYWKSLYLGGLSDTHIDRLVETAGTMPSEQCMIALWHLGGAMARVPEDATAFGKRNAPYMLSFDSCWTDRALTDIVIDWTRAQITASQPFAAGGLYLNFPGVGENSEDLVREAYGPNYARLAEIKGHYDPDNLFRLNQNVRPS
jgi:FAD/FMN-containing dehydrogenase